MSKKNLLFASKRRTQIGECKVKKSKNYYGKSSPELEGSGEEKTRDQEVVNCASSVDPFSAVVEDVPPEMTIDTSSKYPVPTSRWCLVAV